MYVYVCFDVEDLVQPDSDDVARDIAARLADDGIIASMCVVAEKARLWERRGRADVIAAVAQHDVGLHTNLHSVHPTVAEYLADKGWADGVAEAMGQEAPGLRDLTRIFGLFPSTWATAGASWGPQIAAATHRLGLPSNVYSFARAGRTGATWFAGQLCYSDYISLPGGEDACCDDAAFAGALPRLLGQIEERQREGHPCTGLFAGHPTRFRYTVFWDALNFDRGQNTLAEAYRFAPRRSDAAYNRGLRNLRRLLAAVRDLPGVELLSIRALNNRFAPETGVIPWTELPRLAQQVLDSVIIDAEDPLVSPAQRLDLLARGFLRLVSAGKAPAHLLVRRVLGPEAPAPSLRQSVIIDGATALVLCRTLVSHIDVTGHLPTTLTVDGATIGPGTLLRGLAALFLASRPGAPAEQVALHTGAEEPAVAAGLVDALYQQLPGWPPHRSDLRLDQLALHTRLQSWSLKPALPTT